MPNTNQIAQRLYQRSPENEIIHMLSDDLESKYDIPALLLRLKMPPAEIQSKEFGLLFIIVNRKV